MTPKVTVVLSTFNRAAHLPQNLDALMGQTFGDFELLICDDASTDDTRKICESYERRDSRIQYYPAASNVGMPGNVNRGFRAARGEFVANLHDGDIYEPDLLESWLSALTKFPDAGFVFNAYRALDTEGKTARLYRLSLGECTDGRRFLETVCYPRWRFDSPVWGTVMVRKSVYDALGLFDPRYGFIADVDMWFRIAENYDVAYVDRPLIALPSQHAVPTRIRDSAWKRQTVIEKIFIASVQRLFPRGSARRGYWMTRLAANACVKRVWLAALLIRRRVIAATARAMSFR